MNPLTVLYEYAKAHHLDDDAYFEENEVEFLLLSGPKGEWELKRLQGPRKGRGMPMHMPIPIKRTSGIRPNFPADNPAYVLGVELDEDKPDQEWTDQCHAEYVKLVRRVAEEADDRGLARVADLLEGTDARGFAKEAKRLGMKSGDTVCPAVKVDGEWQAVSERHPVRKWWAKNFGALSKIEGDVMMCQVTGEMAPVARTHPLVTGMRGGRSTGITFMTNNEPSGESFGRSQGENAPVSVEAAVLYSKALSRLVSQKSGKRRSVVLPDNLYMLFVTKRDEEERAADFVLSLLDPRESDMPVEGDGFAHRDIHVWRAHRNLFAAPNTGEVLPPPETPVDILMVRPNGARIELRSYFEIPFDGVHSNLKGYFDDLSVIDPFLGAVRNDFVLRSVWSRPDGPEGKAKVVKRGLMDALRNDRNGEYPRWEVQSGMFMAAIGGGPFPPDILRLTLERVSRAAKDSDYGAVPVECAALLKAYLNRETRRPESGMLRRWSHYDPKFTGVREMLDTTNKHPAYVHGRLMAIAERIQQIAIPGVGGSVLVKFFDSASKSPGSVMPGILANSNNHLTKIGRAKPGLAIWCSRMLGEVLDLLPAEKDRAFPRALDMQDQGLFALGYHHQRHKLFEKRDKDKDKDQDEKGGHTGGNGN